MSDNVETLRLKLKQARAVIAQLTGDGTAHGSEGQRAVDYFASEHYDPGFLPWPRPNEESIRPEDLSAANDD